MASPGIWGFPRQGHLPRSWMPLCESTIWVPASSLGECCAVFNTMGIHGGCSKEFPFSFISHSFWWRLINWMDIECTNWMVNLTFRPVCCCELPPLHSRFPRWTLRGDSAWSVRARATGRAGPGGSQQASMGFNGSDFNSIQPNVGKTW